MNAWDSNVSQGALGIITLVMLLAVLFITFNVDSRLDTLTEAINA